MFRTLQRLRRRQSQLRKTAKAVRRPTFTLTEQLESRLLFAATVSSGNWNSASTWQGGLIPIAGDDVTIGVGHTVTYDDTTPDTLASMKIDGKLAFATGTSLELKSTGNIEVTGELEMLPSSATVTHTVTFVNVNETQFVGANGPQGGMVVLASDVGLWVTGGGILDAIGTNKKSWTNLTGGATAGQTTITVADATGWRVGDSLAIAPTLNPTIANNWAAYDERTITAVSGNTITLNSALTYDHPVANGMWKAEVMNLSRNVIIQGEPPSGGVKHRAHVEFLETTNAQTIKNVELRHLGPKKSGNDTGLSVFGRYAMHFHHAEDGSNGSLIENVAAHDIGGHVFVAHHSHGITFKGTISHNTWDDAYWWDLGSGHESNNITYDTAIASRILGTGSTSTRVAGFELGSGTGLKIFDSVAVGNANLAVQSSGFEWPENGSIQPWDFHDNIAHNNRLDGVFTWQNNTTARGHLLKDFTAYYNGGNGIQHGAYINSYAFDGLHLYGNKLIAFVMSASSVDPGYFQLPMTISNSIIDGANISQHGILLPTKEIHTVLAGPTYLVNNTFKNFSGTQKAIYFSYNGGAQGPGDVYALNYVGPYGSVGSNHREWYRIDYSDFTNVAAANQIYATGFTTAGVPYGILPDSDIRIKTKDGGIYNLQSIHFNPTYTSDFTKPSYDTSPWGWYWTRHSVNNNLITPSLVSGEGQLVSADGSVSTSLFTLKQFQAIDVDQTVTARINHNQALAGLIARRSEEDEGTYYKVTVGNAAGGNNLTIWKVVDGVSTSLGTAAVNLTDNVNYRIRFKVTTNGSGTDLQAKVWDATLTEPGTWSLEVLGDTEVRLQKRWGDYGILGTAAGASTPVVFDDYTGTILDTLTWDANANGWRQTFVADGSPLVNVGKDRAVGLGGGTNRVWIDATVTDNGVVNPTAGMTYTWTKISGAGTVTFTTGSSIDTYAQFSTAGLYTLRLTASDGTYVGRDDIQIYVAPTTGGTVSESFTGANYAPWSSAWSGYQVTGKGTVAQFLSNRGMIINPVAPNSEAVFTNNGLIAENVDITSTVNIASSAAVGLVARQSTKNDATFLAATFQASVLQFVMVVDGVRTVLSTTTPNPYFSNHTDYKMRYQVITNADGSIDMRMKIWLLGTSEPTAWTAEFLGWKTPYSQLFVGRAGKTGILGNQRYSGNVGQYAPKVDDFLATSLDPTTV